jgi:hypothetical protein
MSIVRLGAIATVSQGMSRSGRGAGARPGGWRVRAVSSGDIQGERLLLDRAEPIAIEQNDRTLKHLLRPADLVVAARSTGFKAALVPASVERTVADASLNVVRAEDPSLTSYLWWYLTYPPLRAKMQALMVGGTVQSLPAHALADFELPLPAPRDLDRIADLVEVAERAYAAGIEAAELRRSIARDAAIGRLVPGLR